MFFNRQAMGKGTEMINRGYHIPLIYQKMDERGYINPRNENYVWLNEMEWMPIDEIRTYEYDEGENKSIIPFAFTGGGDKWVWIVNDEKKEYPVGLCWHDEDNGIYYAKNTEDAILRQIIEYVSDSNFYITKSKAESYQISEYELMQWLEKWIKCFKNILNDNYLGIIDGFRKLKLKHIESQYGQWDALLTLDESDELIKKYLNFDLLDEEFQWYVGVCGL